MAREPSLKTPSPAQSAPEPRPRKAEPQKEAPRFTAEQLAPSARKLFGVSPSTFAAAAWDMKGSYTVAEMKAHIDKWLKEVH